MGPAGLISHGDVYRVDLGHPIGHEGGYRRFAVVVSVDFFNNGPGGLVVVVPTSRRSYGLRSQVPIDQVPSGLAEESYARCDQLRTINTDRLETRTGHVSPDELDTIARVIQLILRL